MVALATQIISIRMSLASMSPRTLPAGVLGVGDEHAEGVEQVVQLGTQLDGARDAPADELGQGTIGDLQTRVLPTRSLVSSVECYITGQPESGPYRQKKTLRPSTAVLASTPCPTTGSTLIDEV